MSRRDPLRRRHLRAAPTVRPETAPVRVDLGETGSIRGGRHESGDPVRPVRPVRAVPADAAQLAGIVAIARDSGEDPAALLAEVHQFRSALDADLSLAATLDVAAAATVDEPVGGRRGPIRHRGMAAAAAGLVVMAGLGTAVAAVAATHNNGGGGSASSTHVQALELTAAQQYGVLALAAHQRSPGAIVSAAMALHESLTPLIADASSNGHTAHTVLQLLQNEQSVLLASGAATSGPLSGILAQNRVLIAQVKAYTTDTPSGPAISPVALPSPATSPSTSSTPASPTTSAPAASPSPSPSPTTTPTPTPTTTPPASPTPTPSISITTDPTGRVSSAIGATGSAESLTGGIGVVLGQAPPTPTDHTAGEPAATTDPAAPSAG